MHSSTNTVKLDKGFEIVFGIKGFRISKNDKCYVWCHIDSIKQIVNDEECTIIYFKDKAHIRVDQMQRKHWELAMKTDSGKNWKNYCLEFNRNK